ncbi:dolichyl-phosphate-mannose--protein mannosyltransferase [Streptomyces sp. NPDC059506]|uniref:dolichyl-phosphate-mannose--protein mannosyltransferase n=1 Tax=Streptomyces TaxID=1883 RepID=UPI003699365D
MTSETATGDRQDQAADGGRPGAPGESPGAAAWRRGLLRFGYRAPARTPLHERLVPPFPDPADGVRTLKAVGASLPSHGLRSLAAGAVRALAAVPARWWGWIGPVLVALVAGVLRFRHLGSPRAVIFDETYYAKDAWSLWRLGYEGTWPDDANAKILADPQVIPLSPDPSYIVHPPVGKWVIGLGEQLFGLEPLGWRFMTALLGTLSVLMLCRIGRRLFRSTALGCVAGALLAVDGLHFVMSRTALLDLIVMFWIVAAFGCLLVDRDRARARLAAALPDGRPDDAAASRLSLGARPWRLAAGLFLGLACATKWNGAYVLAAFGVMTVLWDMGSRRLAGSRSPFASMLLRDAGPAFASTVPVAAGVYVASWAGWFATDDGYHRDWGGAGPWNALRSLWDYHAQMLKFHTSLSTPHNYESNPWSWLVLGRPVSYFYESPRRGEDGCEASECAREVLGMGTPLLWWTACFALLYMLYRWFFRRDWRSGAILCGTAAGLVPWFFFQERTIFLFYAVVFVPFLCLAVAMMLGALLGPAGASERRRLWGAAAAGALGLLIAWNFAYFFPIYTGETIPMAEWRARMWFDTWI